MRKFISPAKIMTLIAASFLLNMQAVTAQEMSREQTLKELAKDLEKLQQLQSGVVATTTPNSVTTIADFYVKAAPFDNAVVAKSLIPSGTVIFPSGTNGSLYEIIYDLGGVRTGWATGEALKNAGVFADQSWSPTGVDQWWSQYLKDGTTQSPGIMDNIKQKAVGWLLESAFALKDEYKENPHLNINGFSIVLSVPPSLQLNFEFKQ